MRVMSTYTELGRAVVVEKRFKELVVELHDIESPSRLTVPKSAIVFVDSKWDKLKPEDEFNLEVWKWFLAGCKIYRTDDWKWHIQMGSK